MATSVKANSATTKPALTKIVGDSTGTMERVLKDSGFDPDAHKPQLFKLSAPILERGNDRTYMSSTDKMWIFVNTYGPEDGENKLHTHTNEDHSFIVLQGRARFTGPNGEIAELAKHEGIMLPRGTFYTFRAMDNQPLVLLRVGCHVDASKSPWGRTTPDGAQVFGNSKDNNSVQPVAKPGAFFE
jgi:mannose-6-phosphate isomerase-like protein (cupin superfamily)